MVVDFLWSGRKSKIAYATLIQDTDLGGLGFPDLESHIATSLLAWITKLWFDPDPPWASVLKHHLNSTDIRDMICDLYMSV